MIVSSSSTPPPSISASASSSSSLPFLPIFYIIIFPPSLPLSLPENTFHPPLNGHIAPSLITSSFKSLERERERGREGANQKFQISDKQTKATFNLLHLLSSFTSFSLRRTDTEI
jgi:hypothetical protein